MRIRSLISGLAAVSLIAMPTIAAAEANPASSLSISQARAGTPTAKKNGLAAGAGFFGLAILAGIAAIGVIAIVNDSGNDDFPDSP